MKFPLTLAVFCGCIQLLAFAATKPGFTLEKTPSGGAIVKYEGQMFAEYVVDQANKAYLAPVFGPTGKQMTRNYPMKNVPGEKQDHPHHRGIFFGHEEVNGGDFWTERATSEEMNAKKPGSGNARLVRLGHTKHREYKVFTSDRDHAVIVDIVDWVSKDGKKLLEEERRMTFRVNGATRIVDFDQDLIASSGKVHIGDKKDAGLSIRVPHSMAVDSKQGGKMINSEGITNADAWAKRAKWCDFHGPVEGEQLGVAILNHPSSLNFPTPWHVRTYGLFTANAFASKSFDPKAKDAGFEMKSGERIKLRHRFVFHTGDEKSAKIEQAWQAYAKEKK